MNERNERASQGAIPRFIERARGMKGLSIEDVRKVTNNLAWVLAALSLTLFGGSVASKKIKEEGLRIFPPTGIVENLSIPTMSPTPELFPFTSEFSSSTPELFPLTSEFSPSTPEPFPLTSEFSPSTPEPFPFTSEFPPSTPEPTKTSPSPPTETPTPQAAIERQKDGTYVVITEKGESLKVPQIPGLRQEIREINGVKTVVYLAERDNKYGLEENAYAGEFQPNVNVIKRKNDNSDEQIKEQTGGVVLVPEVVLKILSERLEQISDPKDKLLVPLPLNIMGLEENNYVNIYQKRGIKGLRGYYDNYYIVLEFEGELPLMNIIPNSSSLRIAQTIFGSWIYIDEMRLYEPYTDRIYPGKEIHYITVEGNFKGVSKNKTVSSQFGQKVIDSTSPVQIRLSSPLEIRDFTLKNILTVDSTPVFVGTLSP